MIQFRWNESTIKSAMEEFKISWFCLPPTDQGLYRDEREWNLNLTRVIDALNLWCKYHGITDYATGYTQIELCITFLEKKDAMLFKLRWHDVAESRNIGVV